MQVDRQHRRPHLTNLRAKSANRFEEMDESVELGERSYARLFPQTYASADRAARLSKWLTQDDRFLADNRELLDQFCARVIEAGVPLSRSWLHIRTLHPEFSGVSRVWRLGMQTEERFLPEQSCPTTSSSRGSFAVGVLIMQSHYLSRLGGASLGLESKESGPRLKPPALYLPALEEFKSCG